MNTLQDVVKIKTTETGILHITLNRPSSLNALNIEIMTQLQDVFTAAKSNYAVKGLLITGEGKAFCAGADINQLATLNAQTGVEFARHGQKIFRLLEQLGKPSLAAINGFALGGGCELAMAATLRIASTEAVFGQPEIKLGIIPGFGGTQRLSRLVGKARALDLCLTGKTINAPDALNWGLINEVVAPNELLARAESILNHLSQLPPLAIKSIITVIDNGYDIPLEEAFEFEAIHFGLCCSTRDKQEGVKAFLEKRRAEFVGE